MSGKGLEGIIAGESAISTVGLGGGLNYRGYNISELAKHSTFEEVLHLLLYERLPTKNELELLVKRISSLRNLPDKLKSILEVLPKESNCMDIMRTVASVVGILEPETEKNSQIDISIRLIALFGPALLYWYHFQNSDYGRRIKVYTGDNDSVASNFMKLLKEDSDDDPTELEIRTVDISLILYAEHDFNASTFASRVTVSTKSDIYSGLCSAIGTLRGPLHGGANEAAMEFLKDIQSVDDGEYKVSFFNVFFYFSKIKNS